MMKMIDEIAQMKRAIEKATEMRSQIIEGLRSVEPKQVADFERDTEQIIKFYSRFIETFKTATIARDWIRLYSKPPAAERFLQQLKIGINLFEARKQSPPLLQWYFDVCRYRDIVELIIDWLAPYARRFDYIAEKPVEKIAESVKDWVVKHQTAGDIMEAIQTSCPGLLDELFSEIDLDARNAFSHADYFIDLEQNTIRFNNRKGIVVEWTRNDFDVKRSTVWTYYTALHNQWPLVFLPLIIAELDSAK